MLRRCTSGFLCSCFLMICLFTWGCPSTSTPSDGGITDGTVTPTSCDKDVACLVVSDPNIRSCEFVVSYPKTESQPNVGFDDSVKGRAKYLNGKLAVAVLFDKDEGVSGDKPIVFIPLGGSKELKTSVLTCFDRKGAAISSPKAVLKINN